MSNLFPPNKRPDTATAQAEKYYAMDFDRILAAIMDEAPASHLLSIPGVYEAVSEYFNNEVLSRWAREHMTSEQNDE